MIKFKFPTRKLSHMPFPSLVSIILFYFKVWPIGSVETLKYPPYFDKGKLNLMNLTFEEEGSGQSKAPSRSKGKVRTKATQSVSQTQEAQSAPPQPSSEFEARLKDIQAEIGKLREEQLKHAKELGDIQDDMKQDLMGIKYDLAELTSQYAHLNALAQSQDIIITSLSISNSSLHDKVDLLLKHFNLSLSSSSGTTTDPKPTESPAPENPIPSTPLAEPLEPSATPVVESQAPPDPESSAPFFECLLSKSSSTPAGLPDQTIISPTPLTTVPPSFDDAKGGEELTMTVYQGEDQKSD